MLISNLLTAAEISAAGIIVDGDVAIDRTVRFFGADRIRIGAGTRIDAYCVVSAGPDGVEIGRNCHLAVGVVILGQSRVVLEDFVGLSARVSIFSSTEDLASGLMTNPTIPGEFRTVQSRPVHLRRHATVGASSVLAPGVTLGLACSVGALSFVNKAIPDFLIVSGTPPRRIGERPRAILETEARFRISSSPAGH